MPDTHINAYFLDVDEAQLKFNAARGELQAAKDRLEAKKKEVGYEEVPVDTKQKQSDTKPLPQLDNNVSSKFNKKFTEK